MKHHPLRHAVLLAVMLPSAAFAQSQNYALSSAPLGSTLTRIAGESGIALIFDPALTRNKQAPKIEGNFAPEQALQRALAGSGLVLKPNGGNSYRIEPAPAASSAAPDSAPAGEGIALAPITVYGEAAALSGPAADGQGFDAIYDKNYSSDYTGKQRVETYRGTNPADLLQSFSGVYSGDARNSGSIDPNIRGLQGEGRIKVRIDGTEQGLTVWRGYSGASNRNYVDPLLTSNIRIVKDSGLDTGVDTGVGGGIVINTLGINDIVGAEGGFGGEVRLESGANAAKPRIDKDYDGMLVKDIPGAVIGSSNPSNPFARPEWQLEGFYNKAHKQKSTSDQYNLFKGENYAGRIALGYKGDNWDVMGAYAKRSRGNYFAGKNHADYYRSESLDPDQYGNTHRHDPIRALAHRLPPGAEVFNTSNSTDSYLFKAGFQPAEGHRLNLNLRRTESTYGEIMPMEIRWNSNKEHGVQWPLSNIKLNAYSLQYHLNPPDNRWLDLHANLWRTDTKSHLYNAGGKISGIDDKGTRLRFPDDIDPITYGWLPDKLYDDVLRNSAAITTKHTRYGFDLSNRMQFADNLSLTLIGSFQKEKLSSSLKYWPVYDWTQVPRKGRRQEYGAGFNLNWQPTDRLSIDAGAKYSSYWVQDDFLAEQIHTDRANARNYFRTEENFEYVYYTKSPQQQAEFYEQQDLRLKKYNPAYFAKEYETYLSDPVKYGVEKDFNGWYDPSKTPAENKQAYIDGSVKIIKLGVEYNKQNWRGVEHVLPWQRDAQGRLNRDNNPCYNGTIDNTPYVVRDPSDPPHACPGKRQGAASVQGAAEAPKQRSHQWTPSLAVTYRINDDARVYARYNESVRFPSSFESFVGFSGTQPLRGLRPEHSHKFELGYVQNLQPYFANAEAADFKIAYYRNHINNVIDRGEWYKFLNLDKQKIQGIELQARYDSGRFFGDLGVSYQFQNDICDENSAAYLQSTRDNQYRYAKLNRPPLNRCVRDGFYNTLSLTHAVPELSAKLHLGTRLFDRKLELGSRLSYHNKKNIKDYNDQLWRMGIEGTTPNFAYGWDNTFIVDAYARYKVNKNFSLELSGTNLTDQYFVDPSTRSEVPGPGRNINFSFTGRF